MLYLIYLWIEMHNERPFSSKTFVIRFSEKKKSTVKQTSNRIECSNWYPYTMANTHTHTVNIPVLVRHFSAFFLSRRSCSFTGAFATAAVSNTRLLLPWALSSITAASHRRYNCLFHQKLCEKKTKKNKKWESHFVSTLKANRYNEIIIRLYLLCKAPGRGKDVE